MNEPKIIENVANVTQKVKHVWLSLGTFNFTLKSDRLLTRTTQNGCLWNTVVADGRYESLHLRGMEFIKCLSADTLIPTTVTHTTISSIKEIILWRMRNVKCENKFWFITSLTSSGGWRNYTGCGAVTFFTAAGFWMALGTIVKLKADFVKHLRGALICSKCFLAALECHMAAMPEAFLRHT